MRPRQPWRDTARMPRLFGMDVRILALLLVPLLAPVLKLELFIACGLLGGGFAGAELWLGLAPDAALRRLRAALAGRRHAVLPCHWRRKTLWTGSEDQCP